MADTSPSAGLLDRAENLFSLAQQLADQFIAKHEATRTGSTPVNPSDWDRHRARFESISSLVLTFRDVIQKPDVGWDTLSGVLKRAAEIIRRIRDVMQTEQGRTWAEYRDCYPDLFTVARDGREAVRALRNHTPRADPFAFLDESAPDLVIDTTPTMPLPPLRLVEAATRDIPRLLAEVSPNGPGRIELEAARLAKRLQDANHTCAVAHWAIHRAICAGLLRAEVITETTPRITVGGGMTFPRGIFDDEDRGTSRKRTFGGTPRTRPIPVGSPAPYDRFKVVIETEELSRWWSELDQRVSEGDREGDEFARFLELEEMARSPLRHKASIDTLDEYQRLSAKYGNFLVDGILVGSSDLTRMPNFDPIVRKDCVAIPGSVSRICPRSSPKLPVEMLKGIEKRFRELRLVRTDEAILWVGRQANMETVCMHGNGCTCFANDSTVPDATIHAKGGEPEKKKGNPNDTSENTTGPDQPPVAETSTKPKKSTVKGEGRTKLIAALTKHHQYSNGSCLNLEPARNNELARMAGVRPSTASAFFTDKFKGYERYRVVCRDATTLIGILKLLNNEFAPHDLYGRRPPDEDDREEE